MLCIDCGQTNPQEFYASKPKKFCKKCHIAKTIATKKVKVEEQKVSVEDFEELYETISQEYVSKLELEATVKHFKDEMAKMRQDLDRVILERDALKVKVPAVVVKNTAKIPNVQNFTKPPKSPKR